MEPEIFTFSDYDILESSFSYDPNVSFHPEHTDSPPLYLPHCDWCNMVGKGSPCPIRIGALRRLCLSCFTFIEWHQIDKEIKEMEQNDFNVAIASSERKRKVWGFIHPSILCRGLKPHQRKYTNSQGKIISLK